MNKKSINKKGRRNPKTSRTSRTDQYMTHPFQKPIQKIKGPIKPSREEKYLDIASGAYAADTTGTVTALNLTAEGDDNVNRTGREIFIQSVSINGFCQPTATTGVPQQHRVLLVWDNATNGALPAIADILSVSNTVSYPNISNVSRFTILADHKIPIGVYSLAATSAVATAPLVQFDITLPVRSPTRYSGTTGVIASVQNGALIMVTLGSAAAGATAGVMVIASRVTFTDID